LIIAVLSLDLLRKTRTARCLHGKDNTAVKHSSPESKGGSQASTAESPIPSPLLSPTNEQSPMTPEVIGPPVPEGTTPISAGLLSAVPIAVPQLDPAEALPAVVAEEDDEGAKDSEPVPEPRYGSSSTSEALTPSYLYKVLEGTRAPPILPGAEFDFSKLTCSPAEQEFVRNEVSAIYTVNRSFRLEIGRHLIAIKQKIPHGEFGDLINSCFGWSNRTCKNYMALAAGFEDPILAKIANLALSGKGITAFYDIATAEDSVKADLVARINRGDTIDLKALRQIAKIVKAAKRPRGANKAAAAAASVEAQRQADEAQRQEVLRENAKTELLRNPGLRKMIGDIGAILVEKGRKSNVSLLLWDWQPDEGVEVALPWPRNDEVEDCEVSISGGELAVPGIQDTLRQLVAYCEANDIKVDANIPVAIPTDLIAKLDELLKESFTHLDPIEATDPDRYNGYRYRREIWCYNDNHSDDSEEDIDVALGPDDGGCDLALDANNFERAPPHVREQLRAACDFAAEHGIRHGNISPTVPPAEPERVPSVAASGARADDVVFSADTERWSEHAAFLIEEMNRQVAETHLALTAVTEERDRALLANGSVMKERDEALAALVEMTRRCEAAEAMLAERVA
jgi:hypothetical protein